MYRDTYHNIARNIWACRGPCVRVPNGYSIAITKVKVNWFYFQDNLTQQNNI